MGLFDKNNRKGGFMDEIRCDEPSYLIWKGILLDLNPKIITEKTLFAGALRSV